ncbi:hypothetical protein NC981_24950 [Leptolyngbya sp. DQ-M1]|uniref:hypothetical protein n=1 Tax=Leptolyngbya sp. DQ-M1 TaxID=2933920 RepID=UPI00329702CF
MAAVGALMPALMQQSGLQDTTDEIPQHSDSTTNTNMTKGFLFGALLMGSGQGTLWIQGPMAFSNTFGAVDMRINDADNALGDNAGTLQVCFGN